MAERRMFAKTIIDSDAFLDMPQSTQLLYFHLSMRADDDGFINNPKAIMRNCKCCEEDLLVLANKKFIIPFESGVVVIKHWKIHNYIAKDRYKETKYKDEKSMLALDENNSYTTCIQVVDELETQDRLGKDRLGKVSIEGYIGISEDEKETKKTERIDYQLIIDMYNDICVSFPRVTKLSDARKKAIKARLHCYDIEDFKILFEKAEASSFLKGTNNRNWTANFDWLIKDSNMAKVLDGNYDEKQGTKTTVSNSIQKKNDREYCIYEGEDPLKDLFD